MKKAPLLFLAVLLGSLLLAQPETSQRAAAIKPIESLWLMSLRRLGSQGDSDTALLKTLKEWRATGVFDAFVLVALPPTFADEKDFIRRANSLIQEVGGPFILATLPVGTEGWESSANERLAKKQHGTQFDASKAVSQTQWLQTLTSVRADTWGWVLEQPARMPTPQQAARAATDFVRFAKAQQKRTVIWLSAQALTRGGAPEQMIKAVCDATRAEANYFAWMDLPGESLRDGEANWRETLGHLLDKILTLTPKEQTVIQWMNNPRWPTKDVEGTTTYIRICQEKGINRFHVLAPPQGILDRDPWREFYRTIPKSRIRG